MINTIIRYINNKKNPYRLSKKLITKVTALLDYALANDKYTENHNSIACYQYNVEAMCRITAALGKITDKTKITDNTINKFFKNINDAKYNLKELAKKHKEIQDFCHLVLTRKYEDQPGNKLSSYEKRRDKSQSLYEQAVIFHKNYSKNLK